MKSTRTLHLLQQPDVLHVTTVHPPYDGRIYQKEVRALAASGIEVGLATTIESNRHEAGIRMLALGDGAGPRLHRLGRAWRALRAIWAHRRSLVHIHDPELLVVAVVPAMLGVRVVYDVHEFYTDTIRARAWIPAPMRPALAALYDAVERAVLRSFAGVVVVVEGMLARYEPKMPAGRVALVRNFPNISRAEVDAAAAAPHPLGGQPYVVHTGGASRRVAYHLLVAAAEELRQLAPELAVVNIGEIDLIDYAPHERRALRRRAEEAGVFELGRRPYTEVLRWLAHARIGYLPLEDTFNHREALPNKLFEYLRFGLPIVADRVGRVAEIVSEGNVGVLTPADGHAHAMALHLLHRDELQRERYSANARTASTAYSFEGELRELRGLYERIWVSTT